MKSIRNYLGLLILFCIALLNFSCKSKQLPKEKEVVTITKTITELKRDTIIKVEADSSFYNAFIECQNGKPVLLEKNGENYQITSGKNLQIPKVALDNFGQLKISCKYLENQLKITLKEKQILESKLLEKTIMPPPVYIEKQLSWWQKFWLNLGKFFCATVLIYLITKIPWKAFLKP